MKKLLIVLGLVLVSGVAYAVSELSPKTYSWRYKLTIEINTPEGVKTGSSVREIVATYTPPQIPGASYHVKRNIKGEAVVVDLGDKGKIFSTLGVDDAVYVFLRNFKPPFQSEGLIKKLEYYEQLKDQKVILGEQHYPAFMMFENINNPSTVKTVYSQYKTKVKNYFEERFGQGYGIKQITIETTDEDITWGVVDLLPWIPEYFNKRLDGSRYGTRDGSGRPASGLSSGSFIAGGEY